MLTCNYTMSLWHVQIRGKSPKGWAKLIAQRMIHMFFVSEISNMSFAKFAKYEHCPLGCQIRFLKNIANAIHSESRPFFSGPVWRRVALSYTIILEQTLDVICDIWGHLRLPPPQLLTRLMVWNREKESDFSDSLWSCDRRYSTPKGSWRRIQ